MTRISAPNHCGAYYAKYINEGSGEKLPDSSYNGYVFVVTPTGGVYCGCDCMIARRQSSKVSYHSLISRSQEYATVWGGGDLPRAHVPGRGSCSRMA